MIYFKFELLKSWIILDNNYIFYNNPVYIHIKFYYNYKFMSSNMN